MSYACPECATTDMLLLAPLYTLHGNGKRKLSGHLVRCPRAQCGHVWGVGKDGPFRVHASLGGQIASVPSAADGPRTSKVERSAVLGGDSDLRWGGR